MNPKDGPNREAKAGVKNGSRLTRLLPIWPECIGSALLDLPQIAVDGVDRDAELARRNLGTVF